MNGAVTVTSTRDAIHVTINTHNIPSQCNSFYWTYTLNSSRKTEQLCPWFCLFVVCRIAFNATNHK